MKFFLFSFLLTLISIGAIQSQTLLDSAMTEKKIGNFAEASAMLKRYLLSKNLTAAEKCDAHFTLAYLYKRQNLPTASIIEYLRSINAYKHNHKNAMAYYNIGNTYKNFHLYDKAIEYFSLAIGLNEDLQMEGRYLISRSIAYSYNDQYKEAITDALQAQEIANGDIEKNQHLLYKVFNQRGFIKMTMQQHDEADRFFRLANDLSLEKNTYVNNGINYTLAGKEEQAIAACRKGLTLKQNTDQRFKSYQQLGELYLKRNELGQAGIALKEAVTLFEQLQQPENRDVKVFETMADWCFAREEIQSGQKYYKKGISLYSLLEEQQSALRLQSDQRELIQAEQAFFKEVERKEKNKQAAMWAVVISLLVIVSFIVIVIRGRHNKNNTKKLKNEILSGVETILKMPGKSVDA